MPKWRWNGKAPVDLDYRRVYPGEQIEVSEIVSGCLRVGGEAFWEERSFTPRKRGRKPPKSGGGVAEQKAKEPKSK